MGDGYVEGNGKMVDDPGCLVHSGVHLLTPMLRNILAPLSGSPHSALMVGVYRFVYYSEVQDAFLVCIVEMDYMNSFMLTEVSDSVGRFRKSFNYFIWPSPWVVKFP